MGYKIRIELLSDACFSSGEGYNSIIDMDVCYDRLGFPFIPAKRIKGCLREAAIELRDWGEEICIEEIFGIKDDHTAGMYLSDGKLEYYDIYLTELKKESNQMLKHPQRILNAFSYIRTQTSLDDYGIADRNTLRSIRVLKKGLVFIAPIRFKDGEEGNELYKNQLENICKVLRYMGANRTRGMGKVRVSLETDHITDEQKDSEIYKRFPLPFYEEGKKYKRLNYVIYLKSAVLCKSVAGGQTRSCDYIEGAKILGLIAEALKKKKEDKMDFLELVNSEGFICSNAYISDGKKRYAPASAALFQVKDSPEKGRDKSVDIQEGEEHPIEKLSPIGDMYISYDRGANKVSKKSVDKEIRYHHSRPEDKSIGHVLIEDMGSQMYQMESISSGQMFSGFILGSSEQIHKVYELFSKKNRYRIGYNRSAEYGEIVMCVTSLSEEKKSQKSAFRDRFLLKLNAPVILYNQFGMAITDEEVLLEELQKYFPVKLTIEKRFLKYLEVGGYNVTWHARKPTILAFDKGTTFVIKCAGEVNFEGLEKIWLGERNAEGYGEVEICEPTEKYEFEIEQSEEKLCYIPEKCDYMEKKKIFDMMQYIRKGYAEEIVEKRAIKEAKQIWDDIKYLDNTNTVVNQLLLMWEEESSYQGLVTAMEKRYQKGVESKQRKYETAKKIITFDVVKIKNYMREYGIQESYSEDDLYVWYFRKLLTQLKYMVRHERMGGEQKNGSQSN